MSPLEVEKLAKAPKNIKKSNSSLIFKISAFENSFKNKGLYFFETISNL